MELLETETPRTPLLWQSLFMLVSGMGTSKRPCFFEVFGLGWGGVGGGAITFMSLACEVMRRGCYVDVTSIILWCYVEETLMLLLGWGGVGNVWETFAAKAAETKTSATQKKKRKAVFSKLMAFVPQKPLKSHRDSHFSIPFHDFWHTHKI